MTGDSPAGPWAGLAARGVLALHFLFVLFALLGGLLLDAWPHLIWVHLPIAIWAGLIMIVGWTCPLTPLEKRLRERDGAAAYEGGFVEHYLLPLIGRQRLTPGLQHFLGWAVLGLNAILYWAQYLR
jgi:hypothetical protein